jgi:hypothetical protein
MVLSLGAGESTISPAQSGPIHFLKLASISTFHDLTVGFALTFREKGRRIEANFFHALYRSDMFAMFCSNYNFSLHLENVNTFRLENRPKLSDITQFNFF